MRRLIAVLGAFLFLVVTKTSYSEYTKYKEIHIWGRSVVRLIGNGGGGTGFQVSWGRKQYIVTNDHVCGLADQMNRLLVDSPYAQLRMSRIIARSGTTDLCLLTPHSELPPLKLGKEELKPFDALTILGHPELRPLVASHGHVVRTQFVDVGLFLIRGPEDEQNCKLPKNRIEDVFFGMFKMCLIHVRSQLTTAKILPGNSGSPVLDSSGEVRGVAFASDASHKGSIIPLNDLRSFLKAYAAAHKHK